MGEVPIDASTLLAEPDLEPRPDSYSRGGAPFWRTPKQNGRRVLDRGRAAASRLGREATKGRKTRCIPLWWDRATLNELREWKARRVQQGAGKRGPFVCSRRIGSGSRFSVMRFGDVFCRPARTFTIHHGRRTFISHALAGGRTLAEVRAAAGHSNVAITSVYLHVVVDEADAVGDLFGSRS
jgi:integrase